MKPRGEAYWRNRASIAFNMNSGDPEDMSACDDLPQLMEDVFEALSKKQISRTELRAIREEITAYWRETASQREAAIFGSYATVIDAARKVAPVRKAKKRKPTP